MHPNQANNSASNLGAPMSVSSAQSVSGVLSEVSEILERCTNLAVDLSSRINGNGTDDPREQPPYVGVLGQSFDLRSRLLALESILGSISVTI